MPRYDIYRPERGSGYLLDVQSDLLDQLSTRIVVPLLPKQDAPEPATRLNPVFELDGEDHVMVTQFLVAVPVSVLKRPEANLAYRYDDITNALDMVFHGF